MIPCKHGRGPAPVTSPLERQLSPTLNQPFLSDSSYLRRPALSTTPKNPTTPESRADVILILA